MKKYRFRIEQRFAIWLVYGKRCFHCKQPLDFRELTVDHVFPEILEERPEKLKEIRKNYSLDDEFRINDYCNWIPAHPHCNRQKGTKIFPPTFTFLSILDTVKKKAPIVREKEARITEMLNSGNLLGRLGVAYQKGVITREEWAQKIEHDFHREVLEIENEAKGKKDLAVRQQDAIAYTKAIREFESKKSLAEEKRDLSLAYIADVLSI